MATNTPRYDAQNILELEAATQQDPYNANTWYELGVRQQSSERESKAIQALRRCLAIDPSYLPAWLALGVSYTNESNRTGTYNAVREWVTRHPDPRYIKIVKERAGGALESGEPKKLVEILIEMARTPGEAQQVDADVQIVLAVLLNAMEVGRSSMRFLYIDRNILRIIQEPWIASSQHWPSVLM